MRSAGVLMPVASLSSDYGIGTMGKEARNFIDFLQQAGQKYWQMLPISPTGYGDSPYQSVSCYAGNPYWIDFDDLKELGLLEEKDYANIKWGKKNTEIDYETLYKNRYDVLRIAVNRLLKKNTEGLREFISLEYTWLEDYALFMAIKVDQEGEAWQDWPEMLRMRNDEAMDQKRSELKDEVLFWKGVQYLFFYQWNALKDYAHNHDVLIIGDTPIYAASDSADVWANPNQFYLNDVLEPIEVAGCPPDGFSADGQLWGNPLYNWDQMKKDGYSWWIARMKKQIEIYDVVRLDHFRGFDSYYAIPFGEKTARNGHWLEGPGLGLFKAMEKKLGKLNIIAEDLGFLTPSVLKLVKDTGYKGMKVFELGFDVRDNSGCYLPHTFNDHCVVYTGTHDNDTIIGWLNTTDKKDAKKAIEYCRLNEEEGYNWGMMKVAWSSVAEIAIMQAQDLLGIDSKGRINTPSTVGTNWKWRAKKNVFNKRLADKIKKQMVLYGRI